MDIEKTLTCTASAERVWAQLLDPKVMGACVPGMKSIEVLSDSEYLAEMHAPHYLCSDGTGEDSAVASSLKQRSEIYLDERPDGQTRLRMKVQVQVLGRLGTFGLSAMKTKADRLWEEFAANLLARLDPSDMAR